MKPIIIADDEYYYHTNLADALKERITGVSVDTVWSGKELIEQVQRQDYGLIITDYNMGIHSPNGLETSRLIRELGIKTPIFLHSSNSFASEDMQGSQISQFFCKPSSGISQELLGAVAKLYKEE